MNPYLTEELVACAIETKHRPNVLNYKIRLIKELSEINLMFPRIHDSYQFNTDMMDFVPLSKKNLGYSALRSTEDGNCLYSSISLILNDNNHTSKILRLLTSIELFENINFYTRYDYFCSYFNQHRSEYSQLSNLFFIAVSFKCSDSFSTINDNMISELLLKEAYLNCFDKTFSSFICLIALSNVIKQPIESIYPEIGFKKYHSFFNTLIKPRIQKLNCPINILWCNLDKTKNQSILCFKPNHFVALVKDLSKKRPAVVMSDPSLLSIKKIKVSKSSFPPTDNKIQKPIQSKLFFPTVFKNTSDIDKSSFCNEIVKTEVVISKNANNNDKKQMNLESNVPQKESNIVDISLLNTNQLASYSNYDVSSYCLQGEKLKSGTNDHELLSLINNVWVPDKCFQFPLTGKSRKRRFLLKWLDDFSWLCYSKIEDGAYCLPCTLFGTNLPNKYALCKLFKEPYNTWRNAVKVFNDHEKTVDGLHIKSMHCYNMLLSRAKNNTFPIEVSLDSSRKQRIEENKKKLESIVKTIIFLGRSDMPLRGHRDDRKYQGEIGESSKNTGLGNFIELLNFRVDAGDLILKEHLLSAPKNSTYISKTIQNELIECCGNAIEEVLLNDIKKSKYFSIIADEASDCATIEQLSIVIRYVDLNSNIKEVFLRFFECKTGTSGLSIATNILETLKEFGLDIRKCRGQSYDGAASMSGEYKGVSSVIKNVNPKALFVHCASHKLSLVVGKSCQIQQVKNLLEQVKDITYFFNFSPKRSNCLKKYLLPGQAKLIDTCRTRWVQKLRGLDVFFDNYSAVFSAFEEMEDNNLKEYNKETSSKASSFMKLLTNFSFIVSLVLTKQLMDYFYGISVTLQTKSFDISQQLDEIQNLTNRLREMQRNADAYHNKWYKIALALAKTFDIDEKKPRTCGVQKHRDNQICDTVSDYFKVSITLPLLNHLLNELENRFDIESLIVYNGLCAIPASLTKQYFRSCPWKEKFLIFLNFYKSDLPHFSSINAELELWEEFWKEKTELPSTISDTLKFMDMRGFPNILEAFHILATIPITTCECERSISTLRRIKTYTRSTMSENRLNGLALMSIHQEIVPDINRVIEIFASKGDRKLEFLFK
ncbi:52 kDa repressor of the inhibitor of the protein kinase-like [Hydra vulgaris]|uniref:52 kDa repressor of the inhibitor of the protein kinase-like n=1 Tax=Hydra vulgaris TaxID=6087 RepID=UPI0032EA8425